MTMGWMTGKTLTFIHVYTSALYSHEFATLCSKWNNDHRTFGKQLRQLYSLYDDIFRNKLPCIMYILLAHQYVCMYELTETCVTSSNTPDIIFIFPQMHALMCIVTRVIWKSWMTSCTVRWLQSVEISCLL